MEKTLVLIKPDGVRRRLIGEIIGRFERKGLKIVAMKMLQVSHEMASHHYSIHRDKPFYDDLVQYITSSPIVAMILEGKSAVAVVRGLCGATDGSKAAPGTIRGDLSNNIQYNIIHASDSPESFAYEYPIFFKSDEIFEFDYGDENLI